MAVKKTKICGKKYTIQENSWFHKSHLTIFEILTLTYFWWNELPLKFIEKDLELGGFYTSGIISILYMSLYFTLL